MMASPLALNLFCLALNLSACHVTPPPGRAIPATLPGFGLGFPGGAFPGGGAFPAGGALRSAPAGPRACSKAEKAEAVAALLATTEGLRAWRGEDARMCTSGKGACFQPQLIASAALSPFLPPAASRAAASSSSRGYSVCPKLLLQKTDAPFQVLQQPLPSKPPPASSRSSSSSSSSIPCTGVFPPSSSSSSSSPPLPLLPCSPRPLPPSLLDASICLQLGSPAAEKAHSKQRHSGGAAASADASSSAAASAAAAAGRSTGGSRGGSRRGRRSRKRGMEGDKAEAREEEVPIADRREAGRRASEGARRGAERAGREGGGGKGAARGSGELKGEGSVAGAKRGEASKGRSAQTTSGDESAMGRGKEKEKRWREGKKRQRDEEEEDDKEEEERRGRGNRGEGVKERGRSDPVSGNAQMLLALAVQQVNTGNFEQAVDMFGTMIKQGAMVPAALVGRGTAYALWGKLKTAIEDYSKAIEEEPRMTEAWRRRAQARMADGQAEAAVEDLNHVVELEPDNLQAYNERAMAHMRAKASWDAVRDIKYVLQEDPSNAFARIHLGQAYLSGGDCDLAVGAFQEALEGDRNNKEVWLQLAQSQRELGHVGDAEKSYLKAFRIDPRHPQAYRVYSAFKHALGDHRTALAVARQGLQLVPDDLDMRYIEASSVHALGLFSEAVQLYDRILGLNFPPDEDRTKQFQSFYQRELTCYVAMRRHRPLSALKIDDELSPHFKEGWSKRMPPMVLFPGYEMQPLLQVARLPPSENGGYRVTFSNPMRSLLLAAEKLGSLVKYDWQGFLPNKRQYRMAGLAMMDIRDMVRRTWQRMADERAREAAGGAGAGGAAGAGGGSGSGSRRGRRKQQRQQQLQQQEQAEQEGGRQAEGNDQERHSKQQEEEEEKQSRGRGRRQERETEPRKGGGKEEVIGGWREIYDRVVKWRQLGEPVDPVVWIDKLTAKEFEEGFGSVTAMLVGQMKNSRYYFVYDRALDIMKGRMVQDGVWNGYNVPVTITPEMRAQIDAATTAEELWKVIGEDYWVVTPCYSTATPGFVMNGTRLTMVRTPTYFDFAIKTPGTPPRWKEYDHEMETAWKALCTAYLDFALRDSNLAEYRHRIHRAIFSLAFYWYNFMPLARGTAMVGYVTMLGLFLAADMQVTAHVPRGLQADWEGILSPHLDSFIAALSPWLVPSIDYDCPVLANLPSVPVTESLPSLLHIINALSFYDQPAPPITWPSLQ
ncbi:hypothetical protein CLOP_g3433 [Closterium sp. NIES-67]|nr:hypothetical protein CLOP_g3433 [Closterium sp. NIES-67]